jgi:hypothetical protein
VNARSPVGRANRLDAALPRTAVVRVGVGRLLVTQCGCWGWVVS